MDFSDFLIAGVSPLILVPGLVQFIKSATGIKDRAAEILTVAVGAVTIGLAYALNTGLIPAVAVPWINLTFVAVAGGLAIAGYYKLIKAASRGIINTSTRTLVTALSAVQNSPLTNPPTNPPGVSAHVHQFEGPPPYHRPG